MKNPFASTFAFVLTTSIFASWARSETPAVSPKNPDYHPAVAAFFDGKDPFVKEVVLPNIEANRKCDAVVTVVDAEGEPVAGAAISADLARHEFLFGHCDLATEKDTDRTDDGKPNGKYRAIESLLHEKLTTRVSGKTDQHGRFAFRGFHGAYDFSVKPASGTDSTVRAKIGADAPEVRLVMDTTSGTLESVLPVTGK